LSRAVDADDAVDDSDGPLEMTLGPPTGKAKRKKKIKHVNAQLAQLAQRKQLAAALRAFSKAQKKGLIDAHSCVSSCQFLVPREKPPRQCLSPPPPPPPP
jgi:hypothetical protein